jgi:hypothetical protein
MGPGANLGGLGWFVGIWVTMMAAMMLPSAVPMVLLFDRISAEKARRDLRADPAGQHGERQAADDAPGAVGHRRDEIGAAGFEPATFASQTRRANQAALRPALEV